MTLSDKIDQKREETMSTMSLMQTLYVYFNASFTDEKSIYIFVVIFRYFFNKKKATKKDKTYALSIVKIHYTKIILVTLKS